jgi:hypothetical protein
MYGYGNWIMDKVGALGFVLIIIMGLGLIKYITDKRSKK